MAFRHPTSHRASPWIRQVFCSSLWISPPFRHGRFLAFACRDRNNPTNIFVNLLFFFFLLLQYSWQYSWHLVMTKLFTMLHIRKIYTVEMFKTKKNDNSWLDLIHATVRIATYNAMFLKRCYEMVVVNEEVIFKVVSCCLVRQKCPACSGKLFIISD